MQGYIKINRAILFHPSLQKKDRALCEIGAFIWILLEASFKDRNFDINGERMRLDTSGWTRDPFSSQN